MPKYRKKPVEIEAVLFTRETFDEVVRFTNGKANDLRIPRCPEGQAMCVIPTLEGNHIAREGDYIIKGVHGEFYPCKPDIFAKTYEDATITPESLRPKGEWETVGYGITERTRCSHCKSTDGSWGKPPFCNQCGADMRGECV